MGDINANEQSSEYQTLIGEHDSQGRPLADSYRQLHPRRAPEEATFNDWRGNRKGLRIDFILHSDELTPTEAEIVRTSYGGLWPSDHYPVTATFKLERKAN